MPTAQPFLSRRALLAGTSLLGCTAIAQCMASILAPEAAYALPDWTNDDAPATYVGGSAHISNLVEMEGILIVEGDINDTCKYWHSIGGKVMWGMFNSPSNTSTHVACGGSVSISRINHVVAGAHVRVGGSVAPELMLARASDVERIWGAGTHYLQWCYPQVGAIERGLGKNAALQCSVAGKTVDYNGYWDKHLAPMVATWRQYAATGTANYSTLPEYRKFISKNIPTLGYDHYIRSSFDGLLTLTGDGHSMVQVFDVDAVDAMNWLATNGRKQWSVKIENCPEESAIIIRMHGSNFTFRHGYKFFNGNTDVLPFQNANPIEMHEFMRMQMRLVWLYDDDCGRVTWDAAYGYVDEDAGTVQVYTNHSVEIDHDKWWSNTYPYALQAANFAPGSHIVPGNFDVYGSTNGKVYVRDNFMFSGWERHNTNNMMLMTGKGKVAKKKVNPSWI